MNSNLKGFAYEIATSATFGLVPLSALPLVEEGVRFDSILFYRFLSAAIALSGMLLTRKGPFGTEIRNLPILILLGVFYTSSVIFLFWGYNLMAAGTVTTLHFTYSIFVILSILFVFEEKISWVMLSAIRFVIHGIARLSTDGGKMRLNGLDAVIILLSVVTYTLCIVAVNKSRVHDMPGRKLTFHIPIVSISLFFIRVQAGAGVQPIPDLSSFINLILLTFLPTIVSNITLVQAIYHIGSALISILGTARLMIVVCVSILISEEPFTLHLALGILLTVVAATLIILSKYIQKNPHKVKQLFEM